MSAECDKGITKHLPIEPEKPNDKTVPLALTNGANRGRLRINGDEVDVSILGESITFPFSGRTATNRFLKAPMTERLCYWPEDHMEHPEGRGVPTEEYIELYRRWGEGQLGVVVLGNLMIRYDAVEAFGNPIFHDDHDGRLEKFKEMTAAAKAHGSLVIAQLSHPGRQGGKALNPNPVSASDVQLKIKWAGNEFNKPRALTVPEIKEIVQDFANSAYWCHEAGMDGVQIHCAHGYLLAQFLSKSYNLRTDEYGGDLENRSRFVFEVIDAIREKVPDPNFIICVKLNSVEFQAGGTKPEDAQWMCEALERARIDFVDLSGGTFEGRAFDHKKESTKKREAYFIEFAEMIRPRLQKTKVYVTGGFRTASGMVRAIKDGACDGIGLGRPVAAEPYLCREILSGKITGAIDNVAPLPLHTAASGTQLNQIGKGHNLISDLSSEEEVKRWVEAYEKEQARRESILPKVDSSGYPPYAAVDGFAYLN